MRTADPVSWDADSHRDDRPGQPILGSEQDLHRALSKGGTVRALLISA